MKNTLKKVMVVVMAFALLVGATAVPTQNAQAASGNYMGSLKLNWDLKKNKTLKVKSAMAVLKKVNIKIKLSNYKLANASKKGYKKLSFTLTFKTDFKKPSNSKIHKMVNAAILGGEYWFSVADYDTGLSLERKNRVNVTVKSTKWKIISKKTYKDNHNCYVEPYTQRTNVTITYPEDYDGLCIGVGGNNQLNSSTADRKYWLGNRRVSFGQTSLYKKGKKNSHWMRIRASKKTTTTPASTTSPS